MTDELILTEIDHVAIAVRDLEAAIDYYHRAIWLALDLVTAQLGLEHHIRIMHQIS